MLRTLWCATLVTVLPSISSAEDYAITVSSTGTEAQAAVDKSFYLAPELAAAQHVDGEVIGRSSQGKVVVRTNKPADLLALNTVKSAEKLDSDTEKIEKIQLLIGFTEGKQESVVGALEKAGFRVIKVSERGKYAVVEGEKDKDSSISARMLKSLSTEISSSGAKSATPNYKLTVPEPERRMPLRPEANRGASQPADEFFSELWGLRNINASNAWNIVTESPVIVAVIDTGIQHNHPDLQSNIWINKAEANGAAGVDDDGNGFADDIQGWDFFEDNNSVFDDPNSDDHGTHVAGTIGARTDPHGVVGVNWRVQIMPLKFLGPDGGSLDDAVDAILYAVDMGAEILNNSWGGGGYAPVLENAIQEANNAGVLFVAAAGNDASDNDAFPSYPSSYDVPNVIAVAALAEPAADGEKLAVDFSNFGATSVDLAAPGSNILSSIPVDRFSFFSGTSMATPHVSGALALMRGAEECRDLTHLELRQKLLDKARPVAALNGLCVTGATLDIGFLGGDPPDGDDGALSSVLVASKTFAPGSVSLPDGGGAIATMEIELQSAADILVMANSSARSESDDVLVDLRLAEASVPGAWDDAVRFINLPKSGTWTNITVSHGTHLPAGKHVIEWLAFTSGGNLELDGGSISVVASTTGTPQPSITPRAQLSLGASRAWSSGSNASESREKELLQRPRGSSAAFDKNSTGTRASSDPRSREQELRQRRSGGSKASKKSGPAGRSDRSRIMETKGQMEEMPKAKQR